MPIAKRRSISVDKFVDDAVNDLRASAIRRGLDVNYTTAFNMFAEYGILKMKEMTTSPDALFIQVFNKYWNYDEMKEYGLWDEWTSFQEYKEWKQKQQEKAIQQSNEPNEPSSTTKKPNYIS